MIFDGMKKWEMGLITGVMCAAGIWECLGRFIHMPFWVGLTAYALPFTVICLWRPVMFFRSYPRLKKHGERAQAVVTEYRRIQWGGIGSGVAEVIRYADKKGKKYERALFTMPMLTRKIGRTYTVYFEPEKEDAFTIVPQCFFAAAVWVIVWAAAEFPAVIMLLLYNGG